ncbi:hypothetical protein Ancab_018606 [Ancistrocladus abbreviatus]
MATISPSPNSSPSAVLPTSPATSSQPSTPPTPPTNSPLTQPTADPPDHSTPSTPSTPLKSPASSGPASPPAATPPPVAPTSIAPSRASPPASPTLSPSPPLPLASSQRSADAPPPSIPIAPSLPPPTNAQHPRSSPPKGPPPPLNSPTSSPQQLSSSPPPSSPPPPSPSPKIPTPSATPPASSPLPPPSSPSAKSPATSPSPPSSPPASTPPQHSPPSPSASPPESSIPTLNPASHSPPTPRSSTPPSESPPPPVTLLTPGPVFHVRASSSPPPSSQTSNPSSANPTVGNYSASSPAKNSSNSGISPTVVVAIGVVLGFLTLSLIGIVFWHLRKRKRRISRLNGGYNMPSPYGSPLQSDSNLVTSMEFGTPLIRSGSSSGNFSPPDLGGINHSRSWFAYQELFEATNGLSAENLLGEGGFGSVYKGCLADGREVAVKQLKVGGGQGEREFKAEVEIISRIHHRHLVSLVGYCIFESCRLLVYDYIPNHTLHYHLHGKGRPVMDWATRLKIASGAARGVAYLH